MNLEPKRVYLAGPMTGLEDLNVPTFRHVSQKLRDAGYEVFCPGDLSIDVFGNLERMREVPEEEMREMRKHLLARELAWICKYAEGLFLLPGWQNSSGALAERATAHALGITIEQVPEEMLPD